MKRLSTGWILYFVMQFERLYRLFITYDGAIYVLLLIEIKLLLIHLQLTLTLKIMFWLLLHLRDTVSALQWTIPFIVLD